MSGNQAMMLPHLAPWQRLRPPQACRRKEKDYACSVDHRHGASQRIELCRAGAMRRFIARDDRARKLGAAG